MNACKEGHATCNVKITLMEITLHVFTSRSNATIIFHLHATNQKKERNPRVTITKCNKIANLYSEILSVTIRMSQGYKKKNLATQLSGEKNIQ